MSGAPRPARTRRAGAAAMLVLAAAVAVAAGARRAPGASAATGGRPIAPGAARGAIELVAPGVLSTPDDELGFALTPDGETAYFTLRSPTTTTPPITAICVTHRVDGRWSEPEIAPFSGRYNDASPAVSPDGRRLVFASDRPAPGRLAAGRDPAAPNASPDVDLWVMERTASGWSEPRDLGAPVDTPAAEQHPSIAADGTLYFASNRPGGKGSFDIWRARWVGGRYAEPEDLAAIDTDAYEAYPAVAPDQSFLVFAAVGRPDALVGGGFPYAKADLYVSFRQGAGWTAPRSLGPPVDTAANESSPSLSPDGRWLYFTSERSFAVVPQPHPLTAREWQAHRASILSGAGNLYRVAIEAIRGAHRALTEPAGAAGGGAPPATAPRVPSPPAAASASPGVPRILGEGVISTAEDEFGGQPDADGRTLYFNRSVPRSQLYTIWVARRAGAGWAPPEVAPFSGTWRDFDPVLSPDGRELFFVSDRPLHSRDPKPGTDYNLWAIDRTPAGLGAPRPLAAPINGAGSAHFASATRDGTLYFTSTRPGNLGPADVWRARRLAGGRYAEPENLGPAINGKSWTNLEAFVAPDESFLVVSAFGHDDSLGDSDLYVSYRKNGVWQPLQSLGPRINSAARDYSPRVVYGRPGGPVLIFASERGLPTADRRPATYRDLKAALHVPRNGLGDLYEVELAAALPPPR
jgi:Tol biopolymer transport system component